MFESQRVLVIGAHTDDAELGAGGTIAKAAGAGCNVHVVALSDARDSLPAELDSDTLRREAAEAGRILGVTTTGVKDWRVRNFPERRQEILEYLHGLGRSLKPDIVIVHSPSDRHQDHATVAHESVRAFNCTILATVLPWNTLESNARVFVRLEIGHIRTKMRALEAFKSQKHRAYFRPDVVMAWAQASGLKARCDYAEEFEVLRIIN